MLQEMILKDFGLGANSLRCYMVDNPGCFIIDMSQLNTFERCPELYNNVYNKGLQELKGPGALFSSLVIHPLLSRWYLAGGTRPLTPLMIKKAWMSFNNKCSLLNLRQNQTYAYSFSTVTKLLATYVTQYSLDFDMYKVASSEDFYWKVMTNIDFLGGKVIFISKPDLVLMRLGDGAITTLDWKTSMYNTQPTLLPFDRQFLGQAWVTDAKFMLKAFMLLPASAGVYPTLIREFAEVDKDLMLEFEKELYISIQQLLLSKQLEVWPKRAPNSCYPFPGITCSFIDLCPLGKMKT